MSIRTLLLSLVLGAVAVFAAANWHAFMTPTDLSFLIATIHAPLGLIMLGLTILLTAMFLIFIGYLQAAFFMDTRRHTRELLAQRELAEQAEGSRFTELRRLMETEWLKLGEQTKESRSAMEARLDQLERDLRSAIEETGNSLAAYIGEFEDRLERDKM